ncbi:MAG: DNA repair protein RecN [Arachidicoccus sp.]|nr:DNA repair protein RecN [Arachidicoccus sp.]
MITQLHISNFAIIDEIDIFFTEGLNIITGETGAGKSILMGALSLILGARADTSVLQYKEKKCVVECNFSFNKNQSSIQNFLSENELDNEGELIIRREISSAGKSRAFINDTPVSLQQLKELASFLVDLHQQFDTLQLGDTDFQRKVLDALAGNDKLLIQYQNTYKQWISAKSAVEKLINQKNSFTKESDFHQYQYNELSEMNFAENELENLDAELQLLSNAEEIKTSLSEANYLLQENENPIVQSLKQIINKLDAYKEFHQQIDEIVSRLRSTQIELQDIARETEDLSEAFGTDEERMQIINERISAGYKLLKKHGVSTTNELLQIQNELSEKLEAVLNIDEEIEKQEKLKELLEKEAFALAKKLSDARQKQIPKIEIAVNEKLHRIGMPNATLKIQLKEDTALNFYGINQIEFLFDANKSNRFEPIRKVASGGELSRLMLCIKSLVAQSVELPTLIFDEIDTGISGEAAKQVGIIMKELSANLQVIAITHQPQIAAKSHTHFYVFKEVSQQGIKTNIKILNKDESIYSIAQMLGGEKPTGAALQSAREMTED